VQYLFSTDTGGGGDAGAAGGTAGGGAGNEWAKLRAADGHPAPYNISWFEIGNECQTPDFGGRAQVPTLLLLYY
jgi:hypothetical protein